MRQIRLGKLLNSWYALWLAAKIWTKTIRERKILRKRSRNCRYKIRLIYQSPEKKKVAFEEGGRKPGPIFADSLPFYDRDQEACPPFYASGRTHRFLSIKSRLSLLSSPLFIYFLCLILKSLYNGGVLSIYIEINKIRLIETQIYFNK
jgi:hypothetical protein